MNSLSQEDLELMLVATVRNSLPMPGYLADQVARIVRNCLPAASTRCVKQLLKDMREGGKGDAKGTWGTLFGEVLAEAIARP